MSMRDKILNRKIKKREKHKLNIIKLKELQNEGELEVNSEARQANILRQNKKKKLSKSVDDTTNCDEGIETKDVENVQSEDADKPPDSSVTLETSNDTFDSLELSEPTRKAISEMGFTKLTKTQAEMLPILLSGIKNFNAVAKTGSGKTLGFLIPAVDLMAYLEFKPRNGAGTIILSPTRELALQTYGVAKELMKYHRQTCGLVMGGADKKTEADKLTNGITVLVATPGRLLHHLKKTPYFVYKNIITLIIDEADRMIDNGFEHQLKQIVDYLPKRSQTVLLSATQSDKTKALASFAFTGKPTTIGVDDTTNTPTVTGLEQGVLFSPTEKKLHYLFTLLNRCRLRKVMVFYSSCSAVKYHHILFNYIGLPVMCLHGQQKQTKRTSTFYRFSGLSAGTLLCSDAAARGLDIPGVDWIIQYDPPNDPNEYIHRVGRTARGEGASGRAVLMLRPEEKGYQWYMKEANVPFLNYTFKIEVNDIQSQLEALVGRNYSLNYSAKEAFRGYVRAFQSHHLKKTFNINDLDLEKVAKSFGLRQPPSLEAQVSRRREEKRKRAARFKEQISSGSFKHRR